ADDDLRLPVARLDLAVHLHTLATEAAIEVGGREGVEALRLDDRGEAVEGGVEREQARELRAMHAEHSPLDGGLLADVLLGLVPGDRRLRACHGTERDCHRQQSAAASHAASSP